MRRGTACRAQHSPNQHRGDSARPKPGATAGGCAFDGAQIALVPIADVADRPRPDRLRRQLVGQPRHPLQRSHHLPPRSHHRPHRVGEYNIAGELWHVLPLLDELGLRVLCTLSGDARFREVQTMHRAEANMMVCSSPHFSPGIVAKPCKRP